MFKLHVIDLLYSEGTTTFKRFKRRSQSNLMFLTISSMSILILPNKEDACIEIATHKTHEYTIETYNEMIYDPINLVDRCTGKENE